MSKLPLASLSPCTFHMAGSGIDALESPAVSMGKGASLVIVDIAVKIGA